MLRLCSQQINLFNYRRREKVIHKSIANTPTRPTDGTAETITNECQLTSPYKCQKLPSVAQVCSYIRFFLSIDDDNDFVSFDFATSPTYFIFTLFLLQSLKRNYYFIFHLLQHICSFSQPQHAASITRYEENETYFISNLPP